MSDSDDRASTGPTVHPVSAEQRREMDREADRERGAHSLAAIEADLSAAKSELQQWQDAFDRYSGNNPNKYRTDIRRAKATVKRLEAERVGRLTLPAT
jgi:hypothetical protein